MVQCILLCILKHLYTKDATKDSLEPLLDNKPRFGIFKDIEDGMFIFLDSEKKYADALKKTTELHEFKAKYRETIIGRMNILHLVAKKTMLKEGHVKVEKEKRDVLLIDYETDISNEFARIVRNSRYTNDATNIAVLSWSILKWNSFARFIEMQCDTRNRLLIRLMKSIYSLDSEIKNFIIEFENTKMELVDICECYDENLGDDFDVKCRNISAFIETFNAGVSQSKSNAFKGKP